LAPSKKEIMPEITPEPTNPPKAPTGASTIGAPATGTSATGGSALPAPPGNHLPTRIEWLPAGSWVLYDLANTIYAAVITYILVPYFTAEFHTTTALGLTQTLSMIVSAFVVPVIASMCDRTGQARLFLGLFTVLCVASMAGWALWPTSMGILVLLFVGNMCYQNALTFYNSLLPSVAPDHQTGFVSGLGVGLGYLGTIVTVLVAIALHSYGLGFRAICATMAGLFLLLAIPSLLFVKERRVANPEAMSRAMIGERFAKLFKTLGHVRRNRTLLLFFLGSFFLIDVLNTAILYFASYTRDVFLYAEKHEQIPLALLGQEITAANLAQFLGILLCAMALVCGVAVGWIGDRFHPLRALRLSGWCLLVGLMGGIFAGGYSVFWYAIGMCLFGAFGLAGIWTAGRQVLLRLCPSEEVGEYSGLYGLTNKLSVVGSTTFAVVADYSHAGYESFMKLEPDLALMLAQRNALTCQLIQVVLGIALLYAIRVDDVPAPRENRTTGS
jgi:MFS transporter, UMF1 family